ncbi:MAG: hemolysin III family protein [Alphaproteobacteria bacterium]
MTEPNPTFPAADDVAPAAKPPVAKPHAHHVESLGEEIANAITHGIGTALSIAALAVLIAYAALADSASAIVGSAIYGATLIATYLSSTLYHSLLPGKPKRVFLALDHCGIFFLIAGTYTPICFVGLPGWQGWALFGVIWFLAVFGTALRLIWLRDMHAVILGLYLVMGWIGAAFGGRLIDQIGQAGVNLIILGGVCYTGGLVFYAWRKLPYNHALWHASVLAGSILHFFAILFYVLPIAAAT